MTALRVSVMSVCSSARVVDRRRASGGAVEDRRQDTAIVRHAFLGRGRRIALTREPLERCRGRSVKYIRAYVRLRPRTDSDRLWLTAEGTPLTYTAGQTIFRRLRRRSGVTRLHSHLLRHGFAQAALVKEADPGMV